MILAISLLDSQPVLARYGRSKVADELMTSMCCKLSALPPTVYPWGVS